MEIVAESRWCDWILYSKMLLFLVRKEMRGTTQNSIYKQMSGTDGVLSTIIRINYTSL